MSLPYKYEMLCRTRVVEIGRKSEPDSAKSFGYLTELPIRHIAEGMRTYEVDAHTGTISYLKTIDRSRSQLGLMVIDEFTEELIENGELVVQTLHTPDYKQTSIQENWRLIDVLVSEAKHDRRLNVFADIRHTLSVFEHRMYAAMSRNAYLEGLNPDEIEVIVTVPPK